MPPLFYLASPFSHTDPEIRKHRAALAAKAAAELLKSGVYVYSPIAAQDLVVKETVLPTDWSFWEKYDKTFIDHCDGLIVYMIDGWKESVGLSAEVEYARKHNKTIWFVNENLDEWWIAPAKIEDFAILKLAVSQNLKFMDLEK